MTTEEQKWLVEKLGGAEQAGCFWGKPFSGFRTSIEAPIIPDGYEWVRQRMCELGLWGEFLDWFLDTSTKEEWCICAWREWEEKTPAEKSKLIHDFLKERE